MEERSREDVYDEEISLLMSQIIEICKDAGIAFVATFQLTPINSNGEALHCSSVFIPSEKEASEETIAAAVLIRADAANEEDPRVAIAMRALTTPLDELMEQIERMSRR